MCWRGAPLRDVGSANIASASDCVTGLALVPDTGAGVGSEVQATRPFTPAFRLGPVLAYRVHDQRLDVATLVVGDGGPFGMTNDGTLMSLFRQPVRRFVPDDRATADRSSPPVVVVLPRRGLTV